MSAELVEVVCSDCGENFTVSLVEEGYDPPDCPNCKGGIEALSVPPDGARTIAWVKDH